LRLSLAKGERFRFMLNCRREQGKRKIAEATD